MAVGPVAWRSLEKDIMRTSVLPLAAMLCLTAGSVSAQQGSSPRTPWGDPDLQGTYTNTYENGTPLDSANIRRVVRRLAVQAGIEGSVTPYDLRHSMTTLAAEAGMSADALADLLGHKDTRMVWNHYRHRDGMVVATAAEYWGKGWDDAV